MIYFIRAVQVVTRLEPTDVLKNICSVKNRLRHGLKLVIPDDLIFNNQSSEPCTDNRTGHGIIRIGSTRPPNCAEAYLK